MVLLVQAALGALLVLSTYLVVGVFHGSWLAAGAAGSFLLGILWSAYLVWQRNHPDWWAPWDDGLPQVSRMMNDFVPVLLVFLVVLFVISTVDRR